MLNVEVKIEHTPKQRQAWDILTAGKISDMLYGGARGGGKSKFIRNWMVFRRLSIPKSYGVIIRRKYKELVANHIDPLQREFPREIFEYNQQTHRFRFCNGSVLDMVPIGHLKDVDDLQGLEADIAVDEAQQLDMKSILPKLRMVRRSCGNGVAGQLLLSCNPGGIGHATLKSEFVDPGKAGGLPADRAFVQALATDNPHLTKEFHDALALLPPRLQRAWRFGEWDVFEGQFFPEFTTDMREEPFMIPPHEANIYGSLDYGDGQGANAGATSFGLWHVDRQGIAHRLYTYYRRHENASTYAREIRAAITSLSWTSGVLPKTIWADPSVFVKAKMQDGYAKSVADVFREYELPLTPANNSRINGWRVMREYLCKDPHGVYRSRYWDGYNGEYEEFVPSLMTSETNGEDAEKGGEDHIADEARYFFVGAMGLRANTAAGVEQRRAAPTPRDVTSLVMQLANAGMIGETGI